MYIDCSKLREKYVARIRCRAFERFYAVPGFENYVFSTYCRLFINTGRFLYKEIRPKWFRKSGRGRFEGYILHDECMRKYKFIIPELIARVFLPDKSDIFIFNPKENLIELSRRYTNSRSANFKDKWRVDDLYCFTRNELIDSWQRKLNKEINIYLDDAHKLRFINRVEVNDPDIRNYYSQNHYDNLLQRVPNDVYKWTNNSYYADCTADDEIINDRGKFIQWCMDEFYYYPGDGKGNSLSIDKDLCGFGFNRNYAYDMLCVLPVKYNTFFSTKGNIGLAYCIRKNKDGTYSLSHKQDDGSKTTIRCNTYDDALMRGREQKAKQIRNIVEFETTQGYIPQKTLNLMSEWADKCERGEIAIWEPSAETYAQETGKTLTDKQNIAQQAHRSATSDDLSKSE